MLYRKAFTTLILALFTSLFTTGIQNAEAQLYSPCGGDFQLAGYTGGEIDVPIYALANFQPRFLPTPPDCNVQIVSQTFRLVQAPIGYLIPDEYDRVKLGTYTMWGSLRYTINNGSYTSETGKTQFYTVNVKPLECTASLTVRKPGTTYSRGPGANFGPLSPSAYCTSVSETISLTGPTSYIGSDWTELDLNYGQYQVNGILRYKHNYAGSDTTVRTITASDSFIVYDRTKPEVSFISPEPDSTIDGSVNFLVNAEDRSGIRKVEFYKHTGNGFGTLLHTDTTFPYSYTMDTRLHIDAKTTLNVVAYDKANDIVGHYSDNYNIARATFTIDNYNSPPTLAISKSQIVGPARGIFTFRYNAADVEGIQDIKFYVDGTLATTVHAPLSGYRNVSIDTAKFSNGMHTISGILLDTGGKSALDSFTIRFDNNESIPPEVKILNPETGQTVSGLITIEAQAFDNSGIRGVEFDLNGRILGTAASAPYRLALDTTQFANGVYTLNAIAHDTNGNIEFDKVFIAIENTTNSNAPIVAIFQPQDGSIVSGPAVFINAIATDDISIKSVDFLINGELIGVKELPPYTYRFDATQYLNGEHTLTVRARDYNGNVSESTVTLIVDNTEPVPEIIGEDPYQQQQNEEEEATMDTFEAVSTAMNSHVDGLGKKGSLGSEAKELRMAIKDQLQKLVKLVTSFKSKSNNEQMKRKAPSLVKRMKRNVLALFRKKARDKQSFGKLKRRAKRSINHFMKIL